MSYTLGDLIRDLEQADPNFVVAHGFGRADSYRGYYHDVAFKPKENVTVGEMLREARAALGATYGGYKGGEYTMGEHTDVWIAEYGCLGDKLGSRLVKAMLTPVSGSARDLKAEYDRGYRDGMRAAKALAMSAIENAYSDAGYDDSHGQHEGVNLAETQVSYALDTALAEKPAEQWVVKVGGSHIVYHAYYQAYHFEVTGELIVHMIVGSIACPAIFKSKEDAERVAQLCCLPSNGHSYKIARAGKRNVKYGHVVEV